MVTTSPSQCQSVLCVLLLLPDGRCCRHYCCCAAIPCWAIARLCAHRRRCRCCLFWICAVLNIFSAFFVFFVQLCTAQLAMLSFNHQIRRTHSRRFAFFLQTHVFIFVVQLLCAAAATAAGVSCEYVSKNKKSADCGLELAEPECAPPARWLLL